MKCRSCRGESFGEVIDLGLMPLVNNLLAGPDDPCPRWPLHVVFCQSCSLAQLTHTPGPEAMFDEYLYFSGQSQTMVAHAGKLVSRFVRPGDRVVEIASNDGYLLRQARDIGATILGVDPAQNIAEYANATGVPTRCEYFDEASAARIAEEFGPADVIFANNVLAHVPDPNQIVRGIRRLLALDGVAHVEVPALTSMIELGAFDTIYHEHHSYFSLTALAALFNRNGLPIVDAELIDIHGGSWHIQVRHSGDPGKAEALADAERRRGIMEQKYYTSFSQRVDALRKELHEILEGFNSIGAFGAAAKGVILLNCLELEQTRIPWVADVSPHKQGRFIPGTLQKVVEPAELLRAMPQATLILPWNIKDEIVNRNHEYVNQGGRFIVPIPEVAIL